MSGGLTHDQLVVACKNIGFDLTCGACACVFMTGHGGVYPHDASCTSQVSVDVENVRWQERIAETIQSEGLEPFDASGNESGDPLDFTDDQVRAAIHAAEERGADREREACADALTDWARDWASTGPGQVSDAFERATLAYAERVRAGKPADMAKDRDTDMADRQQTGGY